MLSIIGNIRKWPVVDNMGLKSISKSTATDIHVISKAANDLLVPLSDAKLIKVTVSFAGVCSTISQKLKKTKDGVNMG